MVEIDLTGRRTLVTGAGKGIGRAICLTMARAGADVFALSRTREDLESLGEEVRALGVGYGYQVADLRGSTVAEEVAAAAGDVDVLVNNAGVALNAPAELVTEEQWDATLDINVKGAFFMAQAVGRRMLARGHGRIVNVTSQAALNGLADHAAYCASKAALTLITKVLAVEWGARGVTTNAVAPTVILTSMGERVWSDPERARPMLSRIPIGRFGVPNEVASVVLFLASDHAELINGETISVDGGFSAQ